MTEDENGQIVITTKIDAQEYIQYDMLDDKYQHIL